MIRTINKRCLMITLALALSSGVAAEAKRPSEPMPPAAALQPKLQLTLQQLASDPTGTLAGAFRCACLRDFLAPAAASPTQAPSPLRRARAVTDPITVEPTLIEDKPAVRIRIQW